MVRASDIAKEVGVSQQVVSAVLRGNIRKASAATREKILEVSRRLNYSPSTVASMLSTGRGKFIALLFPTLEDRFFAELLHYLGREILARNYVPLFSNWRTYEDFGTLVQMLSGCGVAGMITSHERQDQFPGNIPVVCYEQELAGYDSLTIDDDGADSFIFEKLWGLGHRYFAFVGMDYGRKRSDHFRRLLAMHEVKDENVHFFQGRYLEYGEAGKIVPRILSMPEENRPTVVFCSNDVTAIALSSRLLAAGLRVPEDISVVGGDNILESQNVWPPITTIDLNIEEIALGLTDLMISRIEHPEKEITHRTVTAEAVIRQSCGPVKKL